jgi:hypothetical protein
MPLNIGDEAASEGMATAIYKAIDGVLRPPMEDNDVSTDVIEVSQKTWRSLSYAISVGVITHLQRDPPTETEYAEAFSSAVEDAVFWDWLTGFANVFATWIPVPNDGGAKLQTALSSYLAKYPVPSELRGVIK